MKETESAGSVSCKRRLNRLVAKNITNQLGTVFQTLMRRYWVDGLDSRLPGIVALVFIVLLAQAMAAITWQLVPVPEIAPDLGQTNIARTQVQRPVAHRSQAGEINQWHLFGKLETAQPRPKPTGTVETAPETRLNLKLSGVFASKNPKTARAIIADSTGKEDAYAIGDEIPGGAKLHQIMSDRVILEYRGRYETLKLPISTASTADSAGSRRSRTSTRSRRSSRSARTQLPTTGETSALLKQYRDALINDPQKVMGLVRAQPYQKNGKLYGYRIRPGKDRQLLRKFGLRSGDVVTMVNGVPMNNPIKALEVLRDLSTATQVTVDVERNGSSQSFTFSIDQ